MSESSDRVDKGLGRLKQAIARIEHDLNGTTPHRVDPSIDPADHDIIMNLVRLAIWETIEPEWSHLKPEDEGGRWFWAFGRQIGIDHTPDEKFWTMNRRLDVLKQFYEAGHHSIEELEIMFEGRPVKKQLRKLGLLPASNPPD